MRPGQVGNYWLSKRSSRTGIEDAWYRTWYDADNRQTRRVSLTTSDFQEASLALANWVVANANSKSTDPDQVPVSQVLLSYWEEHARKLPSAATAWNGLAYWYEFWGNRFVSKITPREQRRFQEWLAKKGIGEGGVDRILADGRAALNRAVKWQELVSAPHIFGIQTADDKRSRKPMGRPIGPVELAKLFDAAKSRHMLTYLVIASNTLARPGAVLDLRGAQFDEQHKHLDLNPPGRKQNRKFRPILPVTPTLLPWLKIIHEPNRRYVSYSRRPIKSISTVWDLLRKEADLDQRVTPYSIRHGMAREMRKRKVPMEEIGIFLGHLPQGSVATTSTYAPYEPAYCSEAVIAIEGIMAEVRTHLQRANIDQPVYDIEALVKSIPSKVKAGVGEAKREEVRRLILEGKPHKEVVRISNVSSGTVSFIRSEMRKVIPIYRNSESGF
jgi:integrase